MYRISMITGDGIGPELSDSASSVLEAVNDRLGLKLGVTRLAAGDAALRDTGEALPGDTFEAIRGSDACLKAPVGESAADVIVVLRRALDLYANIRPAKSYDFVPAAARDVDMVIVRENTEDLYTGKEFSLGDSAVALRIISERASRRIARHAFELAMRRDRRVTCVHKANVMRVTDGLFVRSCMEVGRDYPDVELEQMYVDACAMDLVRRPSRFDVIVTTNLFGDILSDEASEVAGGLGMAASSNVGDDFAIFEPVHGAAFDIAGRNVANPVSFILSAKLMLEWLGQRHNDSRCTDASERIINAVHDAIRGGSMTRDVGGSRSTEEFTRDVVARLA